jgi:hypothetical protein
MQVTKNQLRAIWGIARKLGMSEENLRLQCQSETGKTSLRELATAEAEALIAKLRERQPKSDSVPLRTQQWRNREAGVVRVASQKQLRLIAELAAQRQWTNESLLAFCERSKFAYPPKTAVGAGKIIQGLIALNKRDALWYPGAPTA